jgi:anti-sigma28 factor (negative regulator of flagellin synthesis)
MKVNDPNLQGPSGPLSTGGSTGVSKPAQTGRPAPAGGTAAPTGDSPDGVALSGLAQTLRSLDVESPERQAQVETLARAYARGGYTVDAEATAGGIITDALKHK